MTLRIGMLTPSSNTVLEPVSAEIVRSLAGTSVHFARFAVTAIGLDAAARAQFDDRPMLAAAALLAHARVGAIAWNGTSASWLGLDGDRRLVDRIEAETGIRAATCVLGLFDLLRREGIARIGLVTPYTADVQDRIAAVYAGEGVTVAAESHLGIRDNFAFGLVDAATLDAQVTAVAAAGVEAIVPLCTNLMTAPHVARWEARHGVPVIDTVAVTLWSALRAGGAPARFAGFGRLFEA